MVKIVFQGNGLRSVLKSTPNVSPSSSKAEGLDGIIWDEENDNMKNSKLYFAFVVENFFFAAFTNVGGIPCRMIGQ